MSEPLYGLMAEFASADALVHACEKTHAAGYRKLDAYSPHPIEELHHALHMKPTRLPFLVFMGGLFGALAGYGLQYFICVLEYPLNIGGRPFHSWPAFIPVTFETTILCAAFAAVFGMIILNGLPMPYHPVFNVDAFERASRDRFFLCVFSEDPQFEEEKTRKFLEGLHPERVEKVKP